MDVQPLKPKSFWEKPEGLTGMVFLSALLVGGGALLFRYLDKIVALAENTLYLSGMLMALAAIIFIILDPKMRNLLWYMYKSIMRWITGIFVQIDPIGILKSYIDSLQDNLSKMDKQIGQLRGQMHKLRELIHNNSKEIKSNIEMAGKAKEAEKEAMMILKTRKAGRLQDSNMRLEDLYKKMDILYRVLVKMHENSEVMLEDIKDQVMVKEVERKAILTSHSAMKSAMDIISGNSDKKMMFDMALESIAEDVGHKMGEMERFMEMSSGFMNSIDLQNGVFEEEGLAMLEQWEKEGVSKILGKDKASILATATNDTLDLNAPIAKPMRESNHVNQYDQLFD